MDERIGWIDTLRGIGIIFVVLGHVYTTESFALVYIYSFHVPLFFFISGYLSKCSRYSGYDEILKDKVRTRIVPYLFFFMVSYIITVLSVSSSTGMSTLSVIATDNFKPMFIQKIALLLTSNSESFTAIHNVALWFIPCLLVTEILFYSLYKLASADIKKISAVLVLAALGGYAESVFANKRLPWTMDIALTALVFYGLGYVCRNLQMPHRVSNPENKGKAVLLFGISTVACIVFATLNGRVDMNGNHYGNMFYFYAGASFGILSYLVIAPLVSGLPLVPFLGKNALIIVGIHLHVFKYAEAALDWFLGLFFAEPESVPIQNDLYVFIISFLMLIFIIPVAYGINRFIPFVVGKTKAARATTA